MYVMVLSKKSKSIAVFLFCSNGSNIFFFSSYLQIGSWSRYLTDIFDIDDAPEEKNEFNDEEKPESQRSFKAFRLLNALSDLMMIPFEMLADKSTRKEV